MENNETKVWWKSKGVVSGLLTSVLGVLVLLGVLQPEAASVENVEALSTNWVDIATSVAIVVGGFAAAYGRIKASTKISKK